LSAYQVQNVVSLQDSPWQGKAMNRYYVYIMTNHSGTLYVGVTNDLQRRVWQHKKKLIEGFTKRYNITRLVYYEETSNVSAAIAREKQIKGWLRRKKIALIESLNPGWKDLSDGWYGQVDLSC
jgi:putative endonuclease